MQPITITFEYNAEDYSRAGKFMRRGLMRGVYIGLIVGLAVPGLVYGRSAYLNFTWLAPLIAIGLVIVVAIPMIESYRIRTVSELPAAQGLFTYTFDANGLKAKGALEQFECCWGAIIKVAETEDDFYFYSAKQLARFLPKKAFADDLQQSQLRMLLKAKLGDKAQLNS